MDAHSFCRTLLKTAVEDLKAVQPDFKPSNLTATKSTLKGYEVQGPDRFYYYASSACCSYCAKAEAIDVMIAAHAETY